MNLEIYSSLAVVAVIPVFFAYYYVTWLAWELFINN